MGARDDARGWRGRLGAPGRRRPRSARSPRPRGPRRPVGIAGAGEAPGAGGAPPSRVAGMGGELRPERAGAGLRGPISRDGCGNGGLACAPGAACPAPSRENGLSFRGGTEPSRTRLYAPEGHAGVSGECRGGGAPAPREGAGDGPPRRAGHGADAGAVSVGAAPGPVGPTGGRAGPPPRPKGPLGAPPRPVPAEPDVPDRNRRPAAIDEARRGGRCIR